MRLRWPFLFLRLPCPTGYVGVEKALLRKVGLCSGTVLALLTALRAEEVSIGVDELAKRPRLNPCHLYSVVADVAQLFLFRYMQPEACKILMFLCLQKDTK